MLKEFDHEIWIADGPEVAVVGSLPHADGNHKIVRWSPFHLVANTAYGWPPRRGRCGRSGTAYCCSQFTSSLVSSRVEARLPRRQGLRPAGIAKETSGHSL